MSTELILGLGGWLVAIVGPVVVWWVTDRPGKKEAASQSAAEFIVNSAIKIADERSQGEVIAREELKDLKKELQDLRILFEECEAKHSKAKEAMARAGIHVD